MIGEAKHTCGRVDGSCARCRLCVGQGLLHDVATSTAAHPIVRLCAHCDGAQVLQVIRRAAA